MTDKPSSDSSSEAATPSGVSGASGKPLSNWTGRISLMIAVVALGAAGYLGYQLIYLQPLVIQTAQTQACLLYTSPSPRDRG